MHLDTGILLGLTWNSSRNFKLIFVAHALKVLCGLNGQHGIYGTLQKNFTNVLQAFANML